MLTIIRNNVLLEDVKDFVNTVYSICSLYERFGAVETIEKFRRKRGLNKLMKHVEDKFDKFADEREILEYLETGIKTTNFYKDLFEFEKLEQLKRTLEKNGVKVSDEEFSHVKKLAKEWTTDNGSAVSEGAMELLKTKENKDIDAFTMFVEKDSLEETMKNKLKSFQTTYKKLCNKYDDILNYCK